MKAIVWALFFSLTFEVYAADFTRLDPRGSASAASAEAPSIRVLIDTTALKQNAPITLHLPNGTQVDFNNNRFVRRAAGDYTWIGDALNGARGDLALISTKNAATYGIIIYQGKRYILQKQGDAYVIRFEPEAERSGIDYLTPPVPHDASDHTTSDAPLHLDALPDLTAPRNTIQDANATMVNVMVLYTQKYADFYGAGLDATIQAIIDYANVALANSNTNLQYTLGYQGLYENGDTNESADINSALNYLTTDDSVKSLRGEQGGDMVSLFRMNTDGGIVGLGWVSGTTSRPFMRAYSFNIAEYSELTFAHEAGHNLGCGHDHYTGCSGMHTDSCGHIDPAFGTIMSYATSYTDINGSIVDRNVSDPGQDPIPYIQYFSNPDVSYNAVPTGISEGEDNASDCADTIIESKDFMALNNTAEEANEANDTLTGNSAEGYHITGELPTNGIFDSDSDSYLVTLGGETNLTLAANEPFFVNVYKNGSYVLGSFKQNKSLNLENGEYLLVISALNDYKIAHLGFEVVSNLGVTRQYDINITTQYTPPSSTWSFLPAVIDYLLH